MKKILVINGPNLNLLGEREPDVYGTLTLKGLNKIIAEFASEKKITVRFFQSNCEGELIDSLHQARKWADGIVFNPGAYTHYSYALRDAVSAIRTPTVEVHLSDIKKREPFRRKSVIADVCVAQISGKGAKSYTAGIELLIKIYTKKRVIHGR